MDNRITVILDCRRDAAIIAEWQSAWMANVGVFHNRNYYLIDAVHPPKTPDDVQEVIFILALIDITSLLYMPNHYNAMIQHYRGAAEGQA